MPKIRRRIALVGCGRVARRHIEALEQLNQDPDFPSIELVAFVDPSPKQIDNLLKKTDAPHLKVIQNDLKRFDSLDKLLQSQLASDLDLVILTTPSGLHVTQAEKVLNAGIDVVVEKPVALHPEEIERLKTAMLRQSATLYPIMQNRYHPTIHTLLGYLESGSLGKIYSASLNLFWNRDDDYFKPKNEFSAYAWRGTRQFDGGLMLNQGIHYLDLILKIIDGVDTIKYDAARQARHIETEDLVVAILGGKNGAYATLHATILAEPSTFETTLTILTQKGVIQLGGATANKINYTTLPLEALTVEALTAPPTSSTTSEYNDHRWGTGHLYQYQDIFKGKAIALSELKELIYVCEKLQRHDSAIQKI